MISVIIISVLSLIFSLLSVGIHVFIIIKLCNNNEITLRKDLYVNGNISAKGDICCGINKKEQKNKN